MQQLLREAHMNNMAFLCHPEQTVCFSGHRTKKFLDPPLHSEAVTIGSIQTLLSMLIADTYQKGARFFITGMAAGVDLWAGEFLLYLQQKFPDVHIIAAVPHPEHEKRFSGQDAQLLYRIGNSADAVICVEPRPSQYCFLRRNDYMLRNAQTLLAVQHAEEGGTAYTIRTAQKHHIPQRILDVRDYSHMIPLLERYPEVYQMTTPQERFAFWEENPRLLYQCGLLVERSAAPAAQ
jgi:uncharacterized phage-like protein YoqJ